MAFSTGLRAWLERYGVAPAYSGGVLVGLTLFFFGAATNTLAGWLYVMSGVMVALVLLGIWLPLKNLQGIQVTHLPIRPVSVGEPLVVEIQIENQTRQAKALIQSIDQIPPRLGAEPKTAIAAIAPHSSYHWRYDLLPQHRGLYGWAGVALRTAAPLGLFWCRRDQSAAATATVYPTILPLTQCPLLDEMGVSTGQRWYQSRSANNATEGLTRALRPYRWGDPTRLIHWRTSARYGELRVREMEQLTADNQVLLALDTRDRWTEADFEAAVVAVASLYVYGLRRNLAIALWLEPSGILQQKHAVLSALAAVNPSSQPEAASRGHRLPTQPLVWLSAGRLPAPLPPGSAWICWGQSVPNSPPLSVRSMLPMRPEIPLIQQLQAPSPFLGAPTPSALP